MCGIYLIEETKVKIITKGCGALNGANLSLIRYSSLSPRYKTGSATPK